MGDQLERAVEAPAQQQRAVQRVWGAPLGGAHPTPTAVVPHQTAVVPHQTATASVAAMVGRQGCPAQAMGARRWRVSGAAAAWVEREGLTVTRGLVYRCR